MANNQNGIDTGDMVKVGAGIAAIAAGAYFFFGPEGKKHQKKMKGWMVKMKGEVLEKLEEARDLSQPVYNEIVDTVAKGYAVAGNIPKEDILALASDLKRHWRMIERTMKGGTKKPTAKKAPAKSAKKKPAKKKSSR